ncbi:hypothetical protein BMJ21_10025 [Sinorhizobium medicae]|nr:hypothetical protein BMJ21_10025 [Sinorhizobium medicae]
MLLWSQTPSSKLMGLPTLEDASAEFILGDPSAIVRSLAPEMRDEIASSLAAHRPGELEVLRRALIEALSNSSADEIAEAILSFCFPYAWLSEEAAAMLIAALGAHKGARIGCAFTFAASVAWTLAKEHSVDLAIEIDALAPVLSLLARATDRSLRIRVQRIEAITGNEFDGLDHAVIFPPIGMRRLEYSLRLPGSLTGEQLGSEAFGALWGSRLGRGRNIVVVGHGLLFRTSSKDAAFKQELLDSHGLEAVLSLPRGTMPGSSVVMSALIFSGSEHRNQTKRIRFIDGSESETLAQLKLGKLVDSKAAHPLFADVPVTEIGQAGFNLSVERYVLDADALRHRELLGDRETVSLSDIADIRRPQALPRDSGDGPTFQVREALLADVDNGRLSLPVKLSELPRSALPKIESATLKPGDILLSIKGTIGKAALVGEVAETSPVPIVPGQSFVIVRLRKGSLIHDPRILVSYLRSPIAQSLLQAMAGGTTIPNVAMGALKDMPVPVPGAKAQDKMLKKFDEYYELLRNIDEMKDRLSNTESDLFALMLETK